MTWLVKTTTIAGRTGPLPAQPADIMTNPDSYRAWSRLFQAAHKTVVLRGHWRIDRAIAYARRHGILGRIAIAHHTADLDGHGYGSIDGRWTVDDDDIVIAETIPVREQREYAEAQADDIWSADEEDR